MSYSARCMNARSDFKPESFGTMAEFQAYKLGHRDARHAAAEIAAEADAEVHDVRAALQGLRAKHAEADATIAELVAALEECASRVEVHMVHTEDLIAHMAACKALARVKGQ